MGRQVAAGAPVVAVPVVHPRSSASALTGSASSGDSVLGVHIPADVKTDALIATLIVLIGALVLGLVIADEAGIGPRHRAWRAYWSYRLTRR